MATSFTLGAIDAGSNAIRVVVARVAPDQDIEQIEAGRVAIRLGKGAFTRGELDVETIDATVRAFVQFRELFEAHGVDRYRAVATSAVRSAANREVLLHRVYHEAGIELEVIDGDEEARLIRKAVVRAFRNGTLPQLVLDLGGGSLEVNARTGQHWDGYSLPVGTVRLVETFGLTGAIGDSEAGMVRRYTHTLLQTIADAHAGPFDVAVACGGNAEAFRALFGDDTGFDLAALEQALPEILGADVNTRMARFDVRRDRAEVMGVAALVLTTTARALKLKRLVVPNVGIRDALLLELTETAIEHKARVEGAQGKALLTAARTFAHRVGHDTAHGEQVRHICNRLFDQLTDVHGLPEDLRVVLEVAALLHDVGEVVHSRGHHKHSAYMVRWGRIPGLDRPYREMVAALARTHRKSPPDAKKHPYYAELPPDRQAQVRRLAAILRIADAFDTEHRQRIDDVLVSRVGNDICLDIVVSHGPTEDDGTMTRKTQLFTDEFGLGIKVTLGLAIPEIAATPGHPLDPLQ